MSEELIAHFGKHKGQGLSDIPSGYLKWAVEKMDPVLLPKYRFHDDGRPMSLEEVENSEKLTRAWLSAAQDELDRRTHHDQS